MHASVYTCFFQASCTYVLAYGGGLAMVSYPLLYGPSAVLTKAFVTASTQYHRVDYGTHDLGGSCVLALFAYIDLLIESVKGQAPFNFQAVCQSPKDSALVVKGRCIESKSE